MESVTVEKLAALLPSQQGEFAMRVGMPASLWPSDYLSQHQRAEEILAWLKTQPAAQQNAETVLRKMAPGLF